MTCFSRVLRDSIPRFVRPLVGRLVGWSVGRLVGPHFTFFIFLRSLASLLLAKCFSNSNNAPARPQATEVAAYPALFKIKNESSLSTVRPLKKRTASLDFFINQSKRKIIDALLLLLCPSVGWLVPILFFLYFCGLWPHCTCLNAPVSQTLPLPTHTRPKCHFKSFLLILSHIWLSHFNQLGQFGHLGHFKSS